MAGLINELITTLDKLNVLYDELLESAKQKKEAIIKNEIEMIQEINDNENIILGKTEKLDKKRIELFSDIAFVLNKNPDDITITKLSEYIKGQKEEPDVIRVRDTAGKLLKELKEINDQNKQLIEYSLEHAEFSMNLIRSSLSGKPSYYDSLGNELPSSERLFDITQ